MEGHFGLIAQELSCFLFGLCYRSALCAFMAIMVTFMARSKLTFMSAINQTLIIIRPIKPELRTYLQDELKLDPTFYSLRWITTLLAREFTLPDTCRLWDALFAEGPTVGFSRDAWLSYFCVAMVTSSSLV